MTKSIRLALLTGACFLGLAFAAPAFSAYRPALNIEQSSYKLGAATTINVFVGVPAADDATAKLTIFSPNGYSANLTAAPGTKIGRVVAIVKATALGGSILRFNGDVLVANPADPAIIAAGAQCTPGVTNKTVWVLNAQLAGQKLTIPVFVNVAGPYVTQQVCLPPTKTAAAGAQLVAANFTIAGVFKNASVANGYEWAADFTPYSADGTPNIPATTEWRTYVGLPSSLTIRKVKAKHGFRLVGKLKIAGVGLVGGDPIRLSLYGGNRPHPATDALRDGTGKRLARGPRKGLPATGAYSFARAPLKFDTFFQTRFEGYGTTCDGPSPSGSPIPCKGEDIASVTSNQVRVLKPTPKQKHR
jgi:hypothetical protein